MIDALMIFASIVIVYVMLSIAPGIQAQEPELIPVTFCDIYRLYVVYLPIGALPCNYYTTRN